MSLLAFKGTVRLPKGLSGSQRDCHPPFGARQSAGAKDKINVPIALSAFRDNHNQPMKKYLAFKGTVTQTQ